MIGVVTKPQALKGQFRIKPEIFNLKTFKKLELVFLEEQEFIVESVSLRDTFVIMKLKGIDTCEQAEALRNSRVYAEIEKYATQDALTGLNNRRSLDLRVAQEFAIARRKNLPLCVMMLDVDFFKKINDTYGHYVGEHRFINCPPFLAA